MSHLQLRASDGHTFSAYLAKPEGPARGAVVVIQEVFGVTGHIERVAEQFAAQGYLSIAPELFDRQERGVNLPYDQQLQFFGGADGGELTMQFDFNAMQRMYLSLAREDAAPLLEALRERPTLPDGAQWAIFVRNHDELTLDKLSEEERQEVFAAFAPNEGMRLYGRGIRRRLPTMLGDDRAVRLVYTLMFSLPGCPVLFYGEEIGMGEALEVPGR